MPAPIPTRTAQTVKKQEILWTKKKQGGDWGRDGYKRLWRGGDGVAGC